MSLTASELNYAGTGEVYVAPVGTAMPTLVGDALNAAFLGLGYTTDEGVTLTPSQDLNEVSAWQSFYPIDRRVTGKDLQVSFTLLQANKTTWTLNLGGGTWSTSGTTHKFVPASPEVIDYRAMVVHLVDGSDITRILIPKVMVSGPGAMATTRANPTGIDITLGLVTTGSGDPYNVLTNKAAFA